MIATLSINVNVQIDFFSFLTWDVGQHDDDQEVVIVKGHVVFVGKPQGEHARSPNIW